MQTEVSEIEKIIKQELEDETRKSVAGLVVRMTEETQQAINRINGVYSSAINTLKMLELTDAGIFEFFQKTNGNIRVVEIKNDFYGQLDVVVSGRDILQNQRYMSLKEKTKYKIIVMAMEIKEDGAGTITGVTPPTT